MQESITEMYRPKTLSEVVGQDEVVGLLKGHVDNYKAGKFTMPHLFLTGPPGLGKTTCAKALCRDLFGDSWPTYVLELNASDERGIDVIRGEVKRFAQTSTMGQGFNVIVLDECDNLTSDAQASLRRIMDDYTASCRFILACNYAHKVIGPLIDRCCVLRFEALPKEVILARLVEINAAENLNKGSDYLTTIAAAANGSMRKALNLLTGVVDKAANNAKECIDLLYAGKVKDAEIEVIKAFRQGVSRGEFFQAAFDRMDEIGRPPRELWLLGEYDYRIATGGDQETQVRCMVRQLFDLKNKEVKK